MVVQVWALRVTVHQATPTYDTQTKATTVYTTKKARVDWATINCKLLMQTLKGNQNNQYQTNKQINHVKSNQIKKHHTYTDYTRVSRL